MLSREPLPPLQKGLHVSSLSIERRPAGKVGQATEVSSSFIARRGVYWMICGTKTSLRAWDKPTQHTSHAITVNAGTLLGSKPSKASGMWTAIRGHRPWSYRTRSRSKELGEILTGSLLGGTVERY